MAHVGLRRHLARLPIAQISDQTRTFYEALCDHSVPVRHMEHSAPHVFCPTCVVLYGKRIPDDQHWQLGG
jgi:hypothetical protein